MNTQASLAPLVSPDVDEFYRVRVLHPWEQSCHATAFPWEASPDLRRDWMEMMSSKDEVAREIGSIALTRCSKLNEPERTALLQFWRDGGFRAINVDLALSQILLGASPPPILFDLYFAQQDIAFYQANEMAREQLSRLTRHPALQSRANALALVAPMYACGMSWGLNPLLDRPLAAALVGNPNPWIRAAGLFNSQNRFDEIVSVALRSGSLDAVAFLLRPTLKPAEFDAVLAKSMPDGPFEFLMLDHPAGTGRSSPNIDWTNPSREAIEFFGAQTYLGALWRYWNPLLTLPWLFDDLTDILEPGFLAAQVLLGATPESLARGHALDLGTIRRIRGEYPTLAMLSP